MSAGRYLALFDVDGTLVDSQDSIVQAMEAAFSGCALDCPSRHDILAIVGLSLPQAMASLAPQAGPDVHGRLVDAYRKAFLTARETGQPSAAPPLYDGVRAVLDGLRGRDDVLIGVATGKARRGLDHLCRLHGLDGMFATRQTADHHPSKPDPAMVAAALAETGVDASRTVMIGDTSYDMRMGRAAGVRTLAVSWGYHHRDALTAEAPDAIIDRVEALPATLDKLWEHAG